MSVTYSKSKGLYKEGIRIQCFFKHDATTTTALSAVRHDDGFISLYIHDDNGVHFIEVTDKDIDFLMFCDDSQTAFDYALSLIPPSENTDTKSESCVIADSVGVVDSVGDSPSCEFEQILSLCDTCLDLPSFMRCKDVCASLLSRSLSKDVPHFVRLCLVARCLKMSRILCVFA